ncbi:hypothetical protein BCEP4_610012 [Burkholderia cepacia]|nr:hypothetical protein BCEP4_610012 [Burkholderia cepacia]
MIGVLVEWAGGRPSLHSARQQLAGGVQSYRIFTGRFKPAGLQFAFFGEDRTGHVKQFAARLHERPQRRQDATLLRDERRDVGLAAQPADVRVTTHDTGRRARHVGQDTIERAPVVPRVGRTRIADAHVRRERQPHEVLADPRRARGVAFQRNDFRIGEFEDMTGLAAGCRACVEHAHAVTRAKPFGCELRTGILHRHDAVGKPRNAIDRQRRREPHGMLADRGRFDSARPQRIEIRVDARAARIHAQRQRPLALAGREDRLPCVGPRALHRIDPPRAVIPARDDIVLQRRDERVALAQETAQHRIDHPLRERAFAAGADHGHGLVDHRERRIRGLVRRIEQQRERAGKDCVHVRGRRLADEPADQPVRTAEAAHRPVGHVLRRTARKGLRTGRHLRENRRECRRQRSAASYRIDRLRGRVEREAERIGREMQRGQARRAAGRRRSGRTGSCHRSKFGKQARQANTANGGIAALAWPRDPKPGIVACDVAAPLAPLRHAQMKTPQREACGVA